MGKALCDKMMKKFLIKFHSLQVILGFLFGLFVAYVAYANSIDGRPDLMPGRVLLAIFLLAYTGMHFVVLLKKQTTKIHLFTYPIIYIAFGLVWEYASRGYIKNWAPATKEIALQNNAIWLLVILSIMALAIVVTIKGQTNAKSA